MITFKTGHSYIPINTQNNPTGEAGKKKVNILTKYQENASSFYEQLLNTKLICATDLDYLWLTFIIGSSLSISSFTPLSQEKLTSIFI